MTELKCVFQVFLKYFIEKYICYITVIINFYNIKMYTFE